MKKKLTINDLAMGNLKARKKQYITMIIGIVLAMVFSSSTIFLVYSMRDSEIQQSRDRFGNQYAITSVENADEGVYADMKKNELFEKYGIAHTIGFAYNDEEKSGAEVGWLDDKCKELSNITFIEGSYPENENEIAGEKTALLKLGYENAKLGDTIKVSFKIQNDFGYLENTVEKEYKLVGIAADKRQNMITYYQSDFLTEAVPAIFVAQNTGVDPGGKERTLCYYSRPDIGNGKKAWDVYSNKEYNYYLSHNYNYTKEIIGSWETLVLGTGTNISSDLNYTAILSIVLMLASCLAIINSFNSNLKERRKQIGLLRAIGTTRRQIINIFGREAFIISLISTPISIAISYALVFIISGLFGDNFVLTKNTKSLFVCIAVNIIVVMLSALLPLIKISKTAPMHAIRNTGNNRIMKTKRIKSQTSYNMPSLLAKRYSLFYKKSNTAVCIILALTIAMSCIFIGFAEGILDNEYLGYGYDYAINNLQDGYVTHTYNAVAKENGLSNSEMHIIETNPYVKNANGTKSCMANIMVDEYDDYMRCIQGEHESYGGVYDPSSQRDWSVETFAEKCLSTKSDTYNSYKSYFNMESDYVPTKIFALNKSEIEKLKPYAGEINYSKLDSGEEVILIAPKQVSLEVEIIRGDPKNGFFTGINYDNEVKQKKNNIVLTGESTYNAGDTLDINVIDYLDPSGIIEEGDKTDYKKYERKTKIGALLSPTDWTGVAAVYSDFAIITTIDGIENFSKGEKYDEVEVNCNTEITDDVDKEVMNTLSAISDKHDGSIFSNHALIQRKRQEQKTWLLVIVSFVILAFSICAGIINNTITANIKENKRELGTLRAVGAGEKELTMSYIKQFISIFGIGYGAGFGLYLIYETVMYISEVVINKYESTIPFSPWLTIVFCIILFAICSVNLWLKIRKEMKNSIVDNIREL